MCPICLDVKTGKVLTTPCDHLFCEGCIIPYLFKSKKCPICSQNISFETLQHVKVESLSDWNKEKLKELERQLKTLPLGTVKTDSVDTISPDKIYWFFECNLTGRQQRISDYEFECIGVLKSINEKGYYEFKMDSGSTEFTLKSITEYISDGIMYEMRVLEWYNIFDEP